MKTVFFRHCSLERYNLLHKDTHNFPVPEEFSSSSSAPRSPLHSPPPFFQILGRLPEYPRPGLGSHFFLYPPLYRESFLSMSVSPIGLFSYQLRQLRPHLSLAIPSPSFEFNLQFKEGHLALLLGRFFEYPPPTLSAVHFF